MNDLIVTVIVTFLYLSLKSFDIFQNCSNCSTICSVLVDGNFHLGWVLSTGVGKRRGAPQSATVDTDMPLAEEVVVQRKKVKESPESSDEEPLVLGGTVKTASHLSNTRYVESGYRNEHLSSSGTSHFI
jgi:hypothetical protein